MKPLHTDLFPETLLVSRDGDRIFTTSLNVAKYSKKRHREVLRAIENKLKSLPSGFIERNFALNSYIDSIGRKLPMYEMSEEGFALTMMGFTGKEVIQWQVEFIEAFIAMRAQLQSQKEREANALYGIRPKWKAIVEHPDLRRQQLIGLTGHKSPGSITACRRRMRQVGLLD